MTNKFKYSIRLYFYTYLLTICTFSSCKKFVEGEPPKNQINSETVFTSDESVSSAIRGIYSNMQAVGTIETFARGGFGFLSGLYIDELTALPQTTMEQLKYLNNTLDSKMGSVESVWKDLYSYIYQCNSILEGLNRSTGISPALKTQIEGEAHFLRAFFHFYLYNTFGEIPVVTSTDYIINNSLAASDKQTIYSFIIEELHNSQILLIEDYAFSGMLKTRPNKYAATALLARVFLYLGEWQKAEIESSKLIDESTIHLENELDKVFLSSSTEAIWQLMPVSDLYPPELISFKADATALSGYLINAFEAGDIRQTEWIQEYSDGINFSKYPGKYKSTFDASSVTEYSMVLRLAEQYLIRAESRVMQNDLEGAKEDIDIIRLRAGLLNTTAVDRATIMAEIEHERQVELFTEWGHRFFDLKRLPSIEFPSDTEKARIDDVLSVIKPNYQSTDRLFPIPSIQIDRDPNMDQNPGY